MIRLRLLIYSGVLASLLAPVPPFLLTGVAGQQPAAAYAPGRTPWGDPDLQGVFDFQSDVPF